MVRSALMTAVIAILSLFSFPAGAVAVTLQTFAVALTGYMLRPGEAFCSTAAYLFLGACGLPVFSMFSGGIGVLAGPTGGFLWGFPWMAMLCALGKKRCGRWIQTAAGLAGLLVVYTMGTLQLAVAAGMSASEAFWAGAAPFALKDVISVAAACAAGRSIRKKMRLLN